MDHSVFPRIWYGVETFAMALRGILWCVLLCRVWSLFWRVIFSSSQRGHWSNATILHLPNHWLTLYPFSDACQSSPFEPHHSGSTWYGKRRLLLNAVISNHVNARMSLGCETGLTILNELSCYWWWWRRIINTRRKKANPAMHPFKSAIDVI